MKIKEIPIDDILQKKYWKIESYNEGDILCTEVNETTHIKNSDIILHSAIIIEKEIGIYPLLVSKYYEDGGEVGDYFINIEGKWFFFDEKIVFKNDLEGPYISFISTKDIHEYQKGSFDNRSDHYKKFDFYSAQLGCAKIIPYKESKSIISKKVLQMADEEKISFARNLLLEAQLLHNQQKISSGNRKITESYEIIEYLKLKESARPLLKRLLSDSDRYIRLAMMYQLLEIYKDECMKMIRIVAKEDSIQGLAARMNLDTIKKNGKIG